MCLQKFPNLDLSNTTDFLQNIEEEINSKIKKMEETIVQLQKEIDDSYEKFKKTPYYLYSIIIHDGNPACGHFYSLIKDFVKNRYIKYSDFDVSFVAEEKGDKIGFGGKKEASASCLFYVNEDIHQALLNSNMKNFDFKARDDIYSTFCNPFLFQKYKNLNEEQERKTEQAQIRVNADTIIDKYNKKLSSFEAFNASNPSLTKCNFGHIIMSILNPSKMNSSQKNAIGRWLLLDYSYREVIDGSDSLNFLEQNSSLSGMLVDKLPQGINCLYQSKEDENFTKECFNDYKDSIRTAIVTISCLKNFNNEDYDTAMKLIFKIIQDVDSPRKAIYPYDIGKVLIVKFLTIVNEKLIQKQSFKDQIMPVIQRIAILFKKLVTKKGDLHYNQVFANLKNSRNLVEKLLSTEEKEMFEHAIQCSRKRDYAKIKDPFDPLTEYPEEILSQYKEVDERDFITNYNDIFSKDKKDDEEGSNRQFMLALMKDFSFYLEKFKELNEPWIAIHRGLSKAKEGMMTEIKDFWKMEKEQGVDLEAFASQV